MKQFLLLTCSLLAFAVQAQLSYGPENLAYEGMNDQTGLIQYGVTNETDGTLNFYWSLDRNNAPEDWKFSICDKNSCYAYGLETCPSSKPNEFTNYESFSGYQLHIKPEGTNGVAEVYMRMYSTEDPNTIYAEIPFTITVGSATSTDNISIASIALYPNPTMDYFQIRNDENVKHISLNSLLGKKIFDINHSENKSYDISDLSRGIYMVRMFDGNGDVIKVQRLSKR